MSRNRLLALAGTVLVAGGAVVALVRKHNKRNLPAATYGDRNPTSQESELLQRVGRYGWPTIGPRLRGFGTCDGQPYLEYAVNGKGVRVAFITPGSMDFHAVHDGRLPEDGYGFNVAYADFQAAHAAHIAHAN